LETYKTILDEYQARGHNEIDTARVYVGGQQEAFTRAAGWKDRGLSCATKWYPYDADADKLNKVGAHKAEVLEDMLAKSLSELGTDCVDIFYLHRADRSIPFQEPLRKLDELHKQGKFKQLGLSNYSAFEVAEIVMLCKINNWVQPTVSCKVRLIS
jgi:aflatoxin B1 aldehyde reductase